MKVAIVNLAAQEVVGLTNDTSAILPVGQAYFRYQEIGVPFDPATHREVFSHDQIVGAKVIRHFAIEPLTQQEIYDRHLAAGYVDATTGLKLKCTEYAQAKFTQLVTLLSTALAAGAVQPTDLQTIFDFDNTEHELSVADLLALLLRYGTHCAQLFRDHAP